MKSVQIIYSSLTGNTEKVARGIFEGLEGSRISSVKDAEIPEPESTVILAFWVDKGTADSQTRSYLEKLEGRDIITVGTLGAWPDSDHARDIRIRMQELVEQKNRFHGCFLCQGRVDPRLTRKFESLPPDHPHAMTEERRKRHEEAAKHPDARDVEQALDFCKNALSSL